MPKVIAILCSDIHIESVPSWRSAEENWFEAMARPLNELRELSNQHEVPIVCAGDIFTRWFAGPELINFAIKHLPKMYSVRGNHDLPNHRHEEVTRSAYWTLVEAGIIQDLTKPVHHSSEAYPDLVLHPFAWNQEIVPFDAEKFSHWVEDGKFIHLAVVHKYIWKEGCGHIDALADAKVSNFRKVLQGYHASVFGDNHTSFMVGKPGQHMLINCGSLLRRHANDINHKPMVGLLHDDGSIKPYYLDISLDKHVESVAKPVKKHETDTTKVLEGFKGLGKDSLDFRAAIRHRLDALKPNQEVTGLVLRSIDPKP